MASIHDARAGVDDRPPLTVLVAGAIVAAVIVLIPFHTEILLVVERHSPHLEGILLQYTFVGLLDIAAVMMALVAVPFVLERRSSMGSVAVAGALVAVGVIAIGTAIEPSAEGVVRSIRMTGFAGLVIVVTGLSASCFRNFVVFPLAASAVVQSIIAMGQTLLFDTGRSGRDDLLGTEITAGLGTFNHEYALASYLLLAIGVSMLLLGTDRVHRLLWVAVAVCGAGVATTFGRAALLSLALTAGTYAVAWIVTHRRVWVSAAAMPTVPFVAVAAATAAAWGSRTTVQAPRRVESTQVALDLIGSAPLLGTGPGRAGVALAEAFRDPPEFLVHAVPLLVTVEAGVIVGVALMAWLGMLGVGAIRSGPAAIALALGFVPFVAFDNLHYVYASGTMMFAVWVASLGWTSAQRIDPGSASEAVTETSPGAIPS